MRNSEITIKHYSELTRDELYEIFMLRVDVFVVEQNCPCREIDEYDTDCYHLCLRDGGKLSAYLRIIPQGEGEPVIIGRVISAKRRCGLGTKIMREAIRFCNEKLNAKKLEVQAQTYAQPFYEGVGFVRVSDVYIYDSQPHIKMELIL